MAMSFSHTGRFNWMVGCLLVALVGCTAPTSQSRPGEPDASSPTLTQPVAATKAAATVTEIRQPPVFIRPPNASQEAPAQVGTPLAIGGRIRTGQKALAQVNLANGLAFRLSENSVLTLQPDQRLNLAAGDMITWVQPGKKVPTEIVTPIGVAGIRGTTVFVKIPTDLNEGILFFAWEGTVSVRLPGQTEEILLKTAEEVRIRPGDRDINQIRRQVRRLSRPEWQQLRQTDRLVHGFNSKLPTLSLIDRLKPGQASVNDPVPTEQSATQ